MRHWFLALLSFDSLRGGQTRYVHTVLCSQFCRFSLSCLGLLLQSAQLLGSFPRRGVFAVHFRFCPRRCGAGVVLDYALMCLSVFELTAAHLSFFARSFATSTVVRRSSALWSAFRVRCTHFAAHSQLPVISHQRPDFLPPRSAPFLQTARLTSNERFRTLSSQQRVPVAPHAVCTHGLLSHRKWQRLMLSAT